VPPVYYIHPEFGCLCPSPGARRELRVAVVSILFGIAIGAAIVTVGTGHAVETDGVSSNAYVRSSSSYPFLPGAGGPPPLFENADNPRADPVEPIKPYPMRKVRVRSTKAASPLAEIPLGRTAPPEPDSPKNERASVSPADSPAAQSFIAAAEPAISNTNKRPGALHASRLQER
jgi:hypothetical protein